ncbi:MAG: phosphatase, partial [Bacteroidota bacterium]
SSLPDKYHQNGEPRKEILLEDFRGLHDILLRSTTEERKKMPGMEPVRVEIIVLASIFVNFILQKWNFEKMMLSEYALKEGVIAEILNI